MARLRTWLRTTGPLRVAVPVLVVTLAVGGYLLTSRTIRSDREADASRRAQVVGVRAQGLLDRARAFSAGLGKALDGQPAAGQQVFEQVAGRWGAATGLADALWVQPQGSRLIATYTRSASGGLRPGLDVGAWPGLAAQVRDRSSNFAVTASAVAPLQGEQGFYIVNGGSFGRSSGFLALFVPRGWLTNSLEVDPRRVVISIDGRRLEGALESAPTASTSFDVLGRNWGVEVGGEPLTGLQTILPWLALSWPFAVALVALLIGRAILLRRRAERDVERMFDASIDAMCVAGMDGYFKRVNPGYAGMLGYSEEEILSRPFFDFIHPDDRERGREAMEALARGEKVVEVELRNITSDGSERWLQWNTQPVPGEGVVYATARDVTDRRRAAEQEAALRRVATLVAHGTAPTEVLSAVAEEVARLLDADATRLLRYEPDHTVTVLSNYGEPNLPVGTRLVIDGENLASAVLRTGRPARIESFEGASGPVAAWARDQGVRSGVGAPITVEGRLWGLMIAIWTTRDPHSSEDAENRMAAFTELVATAIANAESRDELAASRARLVEAADEARRRIERDLHDGPQQSLVSLGLALRGANAKTPPEEVELRNDLTAIDGALTETVEELQEIARGVHPAVLTRGGLEPALRNLVRRAAMDVELNLEGVERFPERVEVAAYYVVSEALTNAAKHAGASAVDVDVQARDSVLNLAIRDNGVGGADPSRGSGLIGLRDRIEAVGGTVEIESNPGKGTSLRATIPTG
jgi:PAS domain S-box-containing protein